MKKNAVIIVLVLVSASLFLYAFIKADEAKKASAEAQRERENAVLLQQLGEELKVEAAMLAAEATRQEALMFELKAALEACQNK